MSVVHKFGEESLSDVVFVVGDEEFHCHRMGLASRSAYFASMFASNFKEKDEERIDIEADPLAFKKLMEILYKGYFKGYVKLFSMTQEGDDDGKHIKALWKETSALLELADRFLVMDIVSHTVEIFMIACTAACERESSRICATKLLLSLRFGMSRYENICKASRETVADTFFYLKQVQKDFSLPCLALQSLLRRD